MFDLRHTPHSTQVDRAVRELTSPVYIAVKFALGDGAGLMREFADAQNAFKGASPEAAAELGQCQATVGSGIGHLVLSAADAFEVDSAIGIELSPMRHRMALAALTDAPAAVASRVRCVEADACVAPELDEASVGWLSNLLLFFGLLFFFSLRARSLPPLLLRLVFA